MPSQVLDHPAVLRALFHPRRDPPGTPVPPYARLIRVPVEPGISVGGRLFGAAREAPTILFFHGNGEIASDYDSIAPLYLDLGTNLLVMDYRGYGVSDGVPTASNLAADAVTIFDATRPLLQDCGLSDTSLFVMGRSLGSAAAVQIALHAGEAVAGLIIESGFAHTFPLLETLGIRIQGHDEERDGFGSLLKIAEIRAPTLIIHGEADWLIPVSNGQALFQGSGAARKRLITIPRAGHNDLLWVGRAAYMDAVRQFVIGDRDGP
jgi:pimeloyl-ACP methyl ester carboxylesterase